MGKILMDNMLACNSTMTIMPQLRPGRIALLHLLNLLYSSCECNSGVDTQTCVHCMQLTRCTPACGWHVPDFDQTFTYVICPNGDILQSTSYNWIWNIYVLFTSTVKVSILITQVIKSKWKYLLLFCLKKAIILVRKCPCIAFIMYYVSSLL